MALVIKDRVKETTTTTGTGNLDLAGAVSGFQSFVSGIGDTNTVYYALIDDNGTAWEIGLGTVSDGDPDTLSRPDNASVIASTNSNNRINLSSGTHTVFATYPAGKAVYLDSSGVLSHSIVNADISGSASIANSKLANSSVSFGGVSVALGASDATPAFDLSDATSYPTSSLSGTITNAQLAGSIANAKLANDGITIAGTDTSLGGSITADTIAGQISANTIAFTQIADLVQGSILYGNGSAATAELTKGSANTVLQSNGTDISWATVTNAMLAGSIANAKLANDSVSYGGVSLDLGGSDATPAFDLSDATNYPTSSLSGTITNAQLAGSIANAKLANASVSFGGVSVALGASDATPAFDLADATNYPTSSLSGTITNAQLAGSIANAKLANSAITVAVGSDSTAILLGGTMTFAGTANEVEVAESSGTVTIGLPSSITANLTGNVTGNTSGSSGSCTGNAATATKLAATVDINGVAFDGSGDITITAAGSTLSDTVTVAKGGTGATSLTDGGILLGSGTGAVTAMSVLGDGVIVVGDNSTDPTTITAFTASDGVLKHEVGGLELDISGIAIGDVIAGTGSGSVGIITSTGHSDGDVLTIQADGTVDWEAVSAGGSGDITAVVAGDGLSGGATSGSATVTLDLNELTAASVADGDSIAIIDANDGNASRKEAVHDLATLFAGTGLTATNSVIAVDASQTQITSVGTIGTGTWQGTAIATAYIADDAITYAKMQNVSADERILGRVSGADGVIEELTKAQVLTFANVEDGADVTDATNVAAAGALMDSEVTNLAFVKALAKGISDGNVLTANDAVADNDFLRIDGTEVEGRTASEVLSDIAAAPAAGSSSIVTVGTVGTGTWQGTAIATAYIADDAVTGAKIALFDDSLAATTTHFLIADGTDYSSFALSGDVTCTNAGVVSIADDVISSAELADACTAVTSFTAPLIEGSTSVQTPLIEYTDGDDAITIHDGGSISVAQAVYHPIANAEAEPEDATVTIDLRKANYFDIEINADVTAINLLHGKVGQRFMIRFEQDATSGPRTVAWDAVTNDFDGGGSAVTAAISWPGGTAPVMTAADDRADTYGFVIRAEGHMDGFVIGQNMRVNDN